MMRFIALGLLMVSVSCFAFLAVAQDQVTSPAEDQPVVDAPPLQDAPMDSVTTDVPVEEAPQDQMAADGTVVDEQPPLEGDIPVATGVADEGVPATAPVSEPVKEAVPLSGLSIDVPVEKEIYDQLVLRAPPVNIERMPSLFLTVWERDLVINARKGLLTRDPAAPDPTPDIPAPDLSMYESPRDLRLSGIVYRSKSDWVIWLNAKRLAPNALPREIMNLKVFKDYIELEWFDAQTNQIFPVRLRPHQRFNLDARVFLPG